MRRLSPILIMAVLLGGCSIFRVTAISAQEVLSAYSVEAVAQGHAEAYVNLKYIALDYGAGAHVTIRGPAEPNGPIVVLRHYEFQAEDTRRVWQIVFDSGGKPTIVEASWEAARVSMPHMPPPEGEPE